MRVNMRKQQQQQQPQHQQQPHQQQNADKKILRFIIPRTRAEVSSLLSYRTKKSNVMEENSTTVVAVQLYFPYGVWHSTKYITARESK